MCLYVCLRLIRKNSNAHLHPPPRTNFHPVGNHITLDKNAQHRQVEKHCWVLGEAGASPRRDLEICAGTSAS